MSYEKGARTAFANKAFVLSEMFNAKFRNTHFSGAVARVVKVFPPETESTGGGKLARESIALVPESEKASGSSIVCCWLDVGQSCAELRSFSVLADRHRERFGDLSFDLNKEEYESFVEEAKEFLANEGLALSLVETSETSSSSSSSSSSAPATASRAGGVQVMRATSSGDQVRGTGSSGPGVMVLVGGAILVGVGIGVVMMMLVR